jgi:hypothetical protein
MFYETFYCYEIILLIKYFCGTLKTKTYVYKWVLIFNLQPYMERVKLKPPYFRKQFMLSLYNG